MKPRTLYVEIFLVSLAVLLLEISYTRIFSFKVYYYFTYLIIGISLLGLGAGGVFVSISSRLRGATPSRVITLSCLLGSIAIFAGYFVIAEVQLNAAKLTESIFEVLKLAVMSLFLFAPFLAAGIVLATIFAAHTMQINRLYCADMLGAALGCAICIPLVYLLTPPGCVMLSGFIFALAALRLAATDFRVVFKAGSVAAAVLLAAAVLGGSLPDPVPDSSKTLGSYNRRTSPVIFSRWSSVFRVDVMQRPSLAGSGYLINHDGHMGSGMHRFNGDLSTLKRFDTDARSYPFKVGKKEPTVLIIGAAGGHEILASLYFGAKHVTGVELNPVTTSLLTTYFADYTGHLAENERVTLVNAEGRSFLRRATDKYDLIWLVAPDTYAAMNAASSGAFVLSESYLYTKEMILESLDHLTDDGIICAQFGEASFDERPNRTARYVATARAAFADLGIEELDKHVLVMSSSRILTLSTVLLRKAQFTGDEVQRFVSNADRVEDSTLRYAWGKSVGDGPVKTIISSSPTELAIWHAAHRYSLDAVTDDAPFFWHFVRFRDAFKRGAAHWDIEDAAGERLLVALLAFVIVFAAVFLLLPFASLGRVWREIPYKTNAVVYFGALGMGFMFLEVSMIQMLTLFLGYPSYSLSVTLFALLIFTGVGSLASGAYAGRRNRVLLELFLALVALVLFYQFGLAAVINRFVGYGFAVRFAVAILLIAPLGLCLGAFMPIGLKTIAGVTTHRAEFTAWGWGVNGFFSVISSILSIILAMSVGFRMVLLMALIVYLIGIVALMRIPARTEAAP